MSTFAWIAFWFGILWMVSMGVVAFAVAWATARDAVHRRVQLHRLRVMYARAMDHAYARDRHRRIATMGAQLAELRSLPETRERP